MELARGIEVPLRADSVASPEVRYGPQPREGQLGTYLFFWLSEDSGHVGRVTFEGFDSIRCCRGEHMPYEDDWVGQDYSRYPWVFEIANSTWLQQRHEYENKHYQTPLLDEYVHYLFSFHDEFVEVIAKGIWFEKVKYEAVGAVPSVDHPLVGLSESLEANHFVVDGIQCMVRHNPIPISELLGRSKLCSQILFQYYITLDGSTKPSYSASLRTIHGKAVTKLSGGLFYKQLLNVEGVGTESEFRQAFNSYVQEVAERRRKMGK